MEDDWEVLHRHDSPPDSNDPSRGIDADSQGLIRSDYFSLLPTTYAAGADASVPGPVVPDNPSWVDPGSDSETHYVRNLSDSESGRSDVGREMSDLDAKRDLGLVEDANSQVGFLGVDEIRTEPKGSGDGEFVSGCNSHDHRELVFVEDVKSIEGSQGGYVAQAEDEGFGEKSGGAVFVMESENGNERGDGCDECQRSRGAEEGSVEANETGEVSEENMELNAVEELRRVVWWKLPSEFIKFCIFRVSPIWSVSIAAAVMGVVILGRRLYRMKRKSHSLQLKVTVDDKKVSQFTSSAARLNEAFSAVRWVPIVRSSLPAAGVSPWPVMNLR